MRILIADDDTLTRTVLSRHLTSWGHESIEAADGLDALDKLSTPDAPRLAILDEAKSDFLKIISHELRTPLNGLFGFTDLLFEECEAAQLGMPEYRACFEASRQRITSLMDDALLLTRIEVRGEQFARDTCSLDLALAIAIHNAKGMAETRNIHICDAPSGLGLVLGEEQLLTKALQYLVETAVRLSKKRSFVRLECSASDGAAHLVIETDGMTIPPHALPRFFDALSIGDSITREGDFGLSTAVADRIVTLFGGDVAVENTATPGIRVSVKLKAVKGSGK